MDLLIGFLLGVIVGGVAWRARALTRSGALAAILTGGLIFGLGGLPWAAILLTFFISSSALSRVFVRRKAGLSEKFSKGSRRDWGQVLANGGLGTVLVLLHAVWSGVDWFWIAYAGAIAAVTADTWATELGVLSPAQPRLITTGRRVEGGTSGGVTLLGSLGALLGAALIGMVAAGFSPTFRPLMLVLVTTVAGLAGSFVDSLLGATVQAIYHCPSCDKETERHPQHTCGSQTIKIRGWYWLNNDVVNFFCSITGAIVVVGGGSLLI